MVYNDNGRSKGIAVVTFARTEHAAVARQKYNHKIIDQSESASRSMSSLPSSHFTCPGRPIRIELIVDPDNLGLMRASSSVPASNAAAAPPIANGHINPNPNPPPKPAPSQNLLDRIGPQVGSSSTITPRTNGKLSDVSLELIY